MNNVDHVCRESKIFLEHAKDNLTQRLVESAQSQNLSEEQLRTVVTVALLTLDESYQKVLPHFQNSLKKFVKE
jgi:hypothetical protein